MTAGLEHRRAQRFPLELPLALKVGAGEEQTAERAVTRDISSSGVYFEVDRRFEPGSRIEFVLRLPIPGAPAGNVLHCLGSIVRVEDAEGGRIRVAARIERHRFLKPDEMPEDLRLPRIN